MGAVAVFTVLLGVLLGLFGNGGDVPLERVGAMPVSAEPSGSLWDAAILGRSGAEGAVRPDWGSAAGVW
ncbi:hypothetical protein GCM10027563_10240 [Parasphingorhabdus pacifica]